jgi:hypothetical protein
LPIEPYVFAEWRVRRGGIDYHVAMTGWHVVGGGNGKHTTGRRRPLLQRSLRFARSEVEVRLTARPVEVFVKGQQRPHPEQGSDPASAIECLPRETLSARRR